ncbi:MFS transporter [[Kitasatospora] papulosa]|uniref:MFS transporter n=1 Tax=[Kitasatospora] papulosa TaxID=1464011 RepID=UPI00369DFC91
METSLRKSVWRDRDFRLFWSGQSIAQVGGQVSQFALPLIVLQLGAGSAAVGFLRAAALLPQLVLSLPAGRLADRSRCRPLMIVSDVVRFAVTFALLVAASLHLLGFWQLLAAVLVIGSCTVLYDICYQSTLPSLVSRDHLASANFALEASRSFATLAGPAAAGFLIGFLPIWAVLCADAVAFAVSAVTLVFLHKQEPAPIPHTATQGSKGMLAGMRQVWHSPVLRPMMLFVSSRNLFAGIFATYVLVFQVEELGFSMTQAAIVEIVGNAGFLLGVVAGSWLARRLRTGPLLCGGALVSALGMTAISLADGPPALPLMIAGLVAYGVGVASNNLQSMTLRLSITPTEVLGRVNGALRVANVGSLPVGAMLGGILTASLGLRTTMIIAAAGGLATTAVLVFSHVARIGRTLPPVEPIWAVAERAPATAAKERSA